MERLETKKGSIPEPLRIVSVSGGKDSTALYLWAIEQWGKNGFLAVFADTGNEHPVTLNYLRNLPDMAGGPPIVWTTARLADKVRSKGKEPSGNPFLDMILWNGRTPSAKAQFCTEYLKLRPIADWLENIQGNKEPIMYTGIRAGESVRRSKMAEREWSKFYDCYTERPLLKWTESQVFDYLKSKGVPPNPLYEAGFVRVGCFPCIHARKADLARLPDWAWDKIESWEKASGRSWFRPNCIPGLPPHQWPTTQQMREWSKTSRGGVQYDMLAPDAADVPTCMSTWGTCE